MVLTRSDKASRRTQRRNAAGSPDRHEDEGAMPSVAATTATAPHYTADVAATTNAPCPASALTAAAPRAAGAQATGPIATDVATTIAAPYYTADVVATHYAPRPASAPSVAASCAAGAQASGPIVAASQISACDTTPKSIAAPPAATPGPPPQTIGRRTGSNRSTRLLRLAHAREQHARLQAEHARLQVEHARFQTEAAAAHIAVVEAEEAEGSRTDISEVEAARRVDTWLHQSEAHMPAIADEGHGSQPLPHNAPPMAHTTPPVVAAFHRKQAGPEATSSTSPTQPPHPSHYEGRGPPSPPKAIYMPPGSPEPRPNTAVALQPPPRADIAELTAAIIQATRHTQAQTYVPRHSIDLPDFNGNHQEWLGFKAAYAESAHFFSEAENMARLRRSLKGRAREAVDNLLVHFTQPHEIMRALEARFGRPDAIASAELERLRNLQRPADTPRDICVFASRVANTVAALRALNKMYYLYNPEITKITSEKLPSTLRYRWFDFAAAQPEEEPDLLKLTRFLQRESDLCSPFAHPENVIAPATERQQQPSQRRSRQRTFTTQDRPAAQCPVCKGTDHKITDCKEFNNAAVNERWDKIKQARLCSRCLRFRNKKHSCKPITCGLEDCKYFHHKLLHCPKPKEDKEIVTTSWTKKRAQAYLKIAPVRISGPAGEIDTWALLDDGSTVTLIDASIAEEVGARGRIDPLNIEAIADTKLSSLRSRRVSLTLHGQTRGRHRIEARTIEELKLSPQKIEEEDLRSCHHLNDLAGELVADCAAPRLLIGQDNWHLLLAEETRQGRRDQPVASLTPLGWVLHGAHTRTLGHRVNFLATQDEDMNEQLRGHFAIENLMIQPKTPQSDPDRRALEILQANTTQLQDGHYQTALLWKEDNPQMPDNYDAALKRLHSVEKKLKKDTVLAEKYRGQMRALTEKGYAELAPTTKMPGKTWYLPHFAVINPAKPDKVRIVHDAAAKTRGKNLNDFLLTGPDLLQSLPGVLMRFRQHAVAVSADIAEMFMQVKVRPEDRDALRYLWRDSTDEPPTEYRMTSLIFGATCSPSIAIYVKDRNAQPYRETLPEAASAVVRKHYVDDYLDSYETVDDAVRIAREVKGIHKKGHYDLRKWTSNSPEALRQLADETEASSPAIAISDTGNIERVLGLVWKPSTDKLAFNLNLARVSDEVLQSDAPTKREALRVVMSLYDPLGLASPVTVRAKQILQELWRRGVNWDQRVETDLAEQWKEWMGHLRNLHHVAVPRCYLRYSDAVSLQLHVFVDASESAYAAALYWRAVTPSGEVLVTLVTAKARVAPLKLTSIPRLELQAAVMGARIATAVIEEHDRKPVSKVFWTDSKTVLTWLKTGSRSYRPFVAHRIAAIEEHTAVQEWRWVPTKFNVADDATRDVPRDFNSRHRWYTGPDFLRDDETIWPTERATLDKPTGEEKCANLRAPSPNIPQTLPDAERFSRWERYLRATARVLQFISLCRPERQRTHYKRNRGNREEDPSWKTKPKARRRDVSSTPTLTATPRRYRKIDAQTLRLAEELIIKASQQRAFADEIAVLQRGNIVSPSSRLRPLSLTYVDGVIRLKSRIQNVANVTDAQRAPPVLDGNEHSVRLLIDHTHRQLQHAGVETTINECRQHHWILRLRPVTRMIIHSCIPCRIRKDSPPHPTTGNHPPCRLAHHKRPFTHTGLDYFGPLLTSVGRSTQKRYVAIFTCLTTRAIHLELAMTLSADSAVMALRRMIARRGCPAEIWSDNGTNLHAADKELRHATDKALEEEAEKRQISWRFIPPGAPFMGGAWERLVRSVKTALAATQHNRHPTDEVLATLLAEAEYTVNSRPLTHVSIHQDDPEAITPNHFLLGGSARVPTPGTFSDSDLIGRTHWRASQRLADVFWGRWLREYLPDLQHRREPHGRGPPLKVGNVVMIVDPTLPRNTWPRGVITAIFPGADGVVRAADVSTKGGTLRRPTKKLVVIPTEPAAFQLGCRVQPDSTRREDVRDGQRNRRHQTSH